MSAYSSYLPKFAGYDAQVVGVSPDSIYSHLAWQEKSIGWQEFPLVSDYWPHAGVAQQFGILREGEPLPGITERAIFIINKQGKIVFSKVYELSRVPDFDEVVAELSKHHKV